MESIAHKVAIELLVIVILGCHIFGCLVVIVFTVFDTMTSLTLELESCLF